MKTHDEIKTELDALRAVKSRELVRTIFGTDTVFGINLQMTVLRNGIETVRVHWDEFNDYERKLVEEAHAWMAGTHPSAPSSIWIINPLRTAS